jgi:hypothetical protein
MGMSISSKYIRSAIDGVCAGSNKQVGAAVHPVRARGSAAAEPVVQGRPGQRSGNRHRADIDRAAADVPHGRPAHAHAPQAAPQEVGISQAQIIINSIISCFSCLAARCVCRQAASKAANCLPLVGLTRSKEDPTNRGHGAQYQPI